MQRRVVAYRRMCHREARLLTHLPQAYELSVLTGTQVLLLVVSETGLVYTFTTPKLQPLVTKSEGKNLIQVRHGTVSTRVLYSHHLGLFERSRTRWWQ